ncbi:MAG: Maf family protein [Alphaproteobacteria bacterium]|nr:Maf family protein [Alphaproteobacteria bacterium]
MNQTRPILLASASAARLALLQNAGLTVDAIPAGIDEDSAKHSLQAEQADPSDAAVFLAEMKATKISGRHPDALVIGADQILTCGDVWFDKAPDMDHLRAHLTALRGKTHRLHSGACVALAGSRIWGHVETADLTMRPFSDDFLTAYLDADGEDAIKSVGGYRLEGSGAQLFDRIEGDYFTILGLPLTPLLGFLRQTGALMV